MFTVCRSAVSVPSSAPAASPRVRRRHSSWPPEPTSIAVPGVASPCIRSARTAARPTSTRFEPVPRLRRFNHWFTLVTPFCLVRRTHTIWQYWPVPALSGLLSTLPSASWIRLPSTSIRPLRRPNDRGLSPPLAHTQRLMAHPHHMEGVQHRDRVGQLISDGVGVAAERVQRCPLNLAGEPVRLVVQPPLVGGSGPADDRVQEPGVQASVLVTGQIDHDRHSPV